MRTPSRMRRCKRRCMLEVEEKHRTSTRNKIE